MKTTDSEKEVATFPYQPGSEKNLKVMCVWVIWPKKLYPHEVIRAYVF
jgi:hypothetical protein